MKLQTTSLIRIVLVVILAVTASACEAIGAIFKAGMVTGVIVVVLILVVVGFVFSKMRR